MKSQSNTAIPNTESSRLDGAAVFLSVTCMVHCLVVPVLMTLFPVVNVALVEDQTFHLIMFVFILPVSVIALTIGCRQHKDFTTLILGGVGLSVLAITAFFGHDLFGETGERVTTTIGGLILSEHDLREDHAYPTLSSPRRGG